MFSPALTAHDVQTSRVNSEDPSAQAKATPADRGAELERLRPSLRRFFAVRTGGDEHLSDDLLQQVCLAASAGGTQVPVAELEFWCRTVARNLLATHWRKSGAMARALPRADAAVAGDLADRLGAETLPADLMARREVQDQLLLALTELDADGQDLIVAHYFRGESHAALATRLNTTERSIEGRLYRARGQLRERLRALA